MISILPALIQQFADSCRQARSVGCLHVLVTGARARTAAGELLLRPLWTLWLAGSRALAVGAGLAALGVACGCSSVSVEMANELGGRRTYIGWVTVEAPLNPANVAALPRVRQLDVTTLGLRLDGGVSLGYLQDRLVSIPLDCRLVIFIRSAAELEHAEKMLRAIGKEDLCVARSSE